MFLIRIFGISPRLLISMLNIVLFQGNNSGWSMNHGKINAEGDELEEQKPVLCRGDSNLCFCPSKKKYLLLRLLWVFILFDKGAL